MTPRFTDKVMVVTGAAQGIGRRVAELAADEGARLVLVDIADYVQGVAGELRDQGVEALAVQANLETWEGAEMVMARAQEQYGRIDILINNVGGTIWAQPFEHYQPEQIQKEIERERAFSEQHRAVTPAPDAKEQPLQNKATFLVSHIQLLGDDSPSAEAKAILAAYEGKTMGAAEIMV